MLKKYRGTFIFAGSAKDEALNSMLETVKGEIGKLGGSVENTDIKGRRTFARPMSKRDSGVYVFMVFNLDTENVNKLLARFKLNDDIFRVQVIVAPPEKAEASEEPEAKAEAKAEA